jgi:hypothetical protein
MERSPDSDHGKRIDEWGWAVFLIMTGALLLFPAGRTPDGTWLIGTGFVLLGLNVMRYVRGVAVSRFTIVLGTLALAAGLAELAGIDYPLAGVLLIGLGVSIVAKPLLR